MRKTLLNILSVLAISSVPAVGFSAVHYVKADGTGDGTSWANAAGNLQTAIDAAQAGDEIWVAQGEYVPEKLIKSTKNTSKSFILKDGVSLYGGFAGNEASKDDRALEDVNGTKLYKNKTVLNANDEVADVWVRANEAGTTSRYTWEMEEGAGKQWVTGTKNNYTHVMYCGSEFKQKTVIDGFTLKGGNANVWNVKANGGAVYAIGDVHISHCRVLENSAYFTAESDVDSNSYGGAIYLDAKGKGTITECYFEATYCHSSYGNGVGGAIYVKNGTVKDCRFLNCVASDNGGAVYAAGSKVVNCYAEACYAGSGGAFCIDATSSIENCVANTCQGLVGGGFALEGPAVHCSAYNCYADAPEYGQVGGGRGAGFCVNGGSMLGCVAYNNQSYAGGGVYVAAGKVVNTTALFNVLRDGTTKSNIEGAKDLSTSVFNSIYAVDTERANFVKTADFDGRAQNAEDLKKVLSTDLSLAEGSKFINAGTLTEGFAEEFDIAGNPRVSGSSIDVGAYEYQEAQEMKPSVVINFVKGTKSARVGVGGNSGEEFFIDWGDGEKISYSKAAYYTHDVFSEQVKVYGGEVRILNVTGQNVTALDITNAPLLQTLQAEKNQLKALDLTGNPVLTGVYVADNQIASIDVSKNTKIRVLDVNTNALEGTLDCSAMEQLSKVDCSANKFTSLVLPHHATMYEVLCDDNQLTTLDLSGLTGLNEVSCHGNKLTALNIDGLTSLESVYAYDNEINTFSADGCTSLKTLNLANNKISAINIEKLTTLEGLYLYDNQLTALDITKNPQLRWVNIENNKIAALNTSAQSMLSLLYADNNEIAAVDFSNNKNLSQLKLVNNKLTSIDLTMLGSLSNCQLGSNMLTTIDVSKCPYLYWFGIGDNMISTLDLSNNSYVQWLSAEKNKLTTLDLANNKGIQGLSLQNNKMDAEAINAIIAQLQDVSKVEINSSNKDWGRQLNISYMPGTEGANVDEATAKGWYVTANIASSVQDLNTDYAVVAKEYFTVSGAALGANVPESGIYIVKTVYSNGTVKFTKEQVVK